MEPNSLLPTSSVQSSGSRGTIPVTTSHRSRPQTQSSQRGDLVLRSTDGREFPAHSILLSLASPVFADMFDIGTRSPGETIEVAETGEMLDLMLKFVYPTQSPTITSFDILEKALHVADKYQLDDMYQQLRQQLSSNSSAVSAYANPLKALGVASAQGLKEEIQLAASLAHGIHDLTTIDGLLKLAENAPASATWVAVIGIPSVKSRVIYEVLFSYNNAPMRPPMHMCGLCREQQSGSSTHYSPPEWQARWCYGLSTELMRRPIRDWKPYFDLSFLYEAVGRHGGIPIHSSKGSCTCLDILSRLPDLDDFSDFCGQGQLRTVAPRVRYPNRFAEWSSGVYDKLTTRLARLEELENLIRDGGDEGRTA